MKNKKTNISNFRNIKFCSDDYRILHPSDNNGDIDYMVLTNRCFDNDLNIDIIALSLFCGIKEGFLRCLKTSENTKNIDNTVFNNTLIKDTFEIIQFCIESIFTSDNVLYYKDIILYNIGFLLDIFEVDPSNIECVRISAFVDYFIYLYTNKK